MPGELMALGALVAAADFNGAAPGERLSIDQGIRASLLCAFLGLDREQWVWPYPAQAAAGTSLMPSTSPMSASFTTPERPSEQRR